MIEKTIMRTVRALMAKMHTSGLSDDELKMLLAQIHDFPDAALASLKQMTLTRTLDVRQAVAVVQEMAKVSPFDNVEAAVVAYAAMMTPESFHLVLDTFAEPADRANVCHRLKIEVDAAGCISGGGSRRNVTRRPPAAGTPGTAASSPAATTPEHASTTVASPGS